jgi:hypothetical protein
MARKCADPEFHDRRPNQSDTGIVSNTAQTCYDSPIDRRWPCLVCGKMVAAERNEREIERTMPRMANRAYRAAPFGGKVVETWYTPVSRYWHDNGVLCGADCSVELTRAAPIPATVSEIK